MHINKYKLPIMLDITHNCLLCLPYLMNEQKIFAENYIYFLTSRLSNSEYQEEKVVSGILNYYLFQYFIPRFIFKLIQIFLN